MKKFGMRCAVVAALGLAMVVFSDNTAANNLADLDNKEIMQKVNGKGGVFKALGAVKGDSPKWDELATKSKEFVVLTAALEKNKPTKGEEASWKKLTAAYAKAAEDLDKAIAAKDGKAAAELHKTIQGSCGACHKLHK